MGLLLFLLFLFDGVIGYVYAGALYQLKEFWDADDDDDDDDGLCFFNVDLIRYGICSILFDVIRTINILNLNGFNLIKLLYKLLSKFNLSELSKHVVCYMCIVSETFKKR